MTSPDNPEAARLKPDIVPRGASGISSGANATLAGQRVKHLLRDLADEPFIALVFPDDGDVKIYVKGVSPDKLSQIQRYVEDVLADRV